MMDAPMIGRPAAEIDTPALLVDLDRMEANIARIAGECRVHGVAWRPHIKGHKSPGIAKLQLAAGAIGVTCAKLGEAEIMVAAGIADILIANQIVGAPKVARLMALGRKARVVVAVDCLAHLDALDAAARAAGQRQDVVIEVDVGMGRAGLPPGPAVVAFARAIAARDGLTFAGLVTWESHAVTIADPEEKARVVETALAQVAETAAACAAVGLPARIVSCGGTGTFPLCIRQPGVTEVQVGGAIFSDVLYRTKFHVDLPPALTLLATVTSRPTPTRLVLDAGKKAMSGDAALPDPIGLPPSRPIRLSAEHATIELDAPSPSPAVGDKVSLVVGYSDTTIHLHHELIGIRGDTVEKVFPVAARGMLR